MDLDSGGFNLHVTSNFIPRAKVRPGRRKYLTEEEDNYRLACVFDEVEYICLGNSLLLSQMRCRNLGTRWCCLLFGHALDSLSQLVGRGRVNTTGRVTTTISPCWVRHIHHEDTKSFLTLNRIQVAWIIQIYSDHQEENNNTLPKAKINFKLVF